MSRSKQYTYECIEEVVDLLNNLNDENNYAKRYINALEAKIIKLYRENEQLRNSMKKLEEKNEKLKLLNESLGLFMNE